MRSSLSSFAQLAPRKWMPVGTSMAAFACMLSITAPAGAVIIPINLTSAGSNGVNITGVNGGMGQSNSPSVNTKNAFDLFPAGGPGDLLLKYQPFSTNWSGFIPSNGLKLAVTGGSVSSRAYTLNQLIESSATWSNTISETLFNYRPGPIQIKRGNLDSGSYLGFQSTVGSDSYYGWMEVTWNGTEGWGGVYRILSAAYESTPNLPIPAGSFTSVPGPLPIFGVAAAFAHSRRLRARLRTGSATKA